MANWLDSSKTDRLWKAIFSRARTSPDKQFFEENIPTAFDLHADEVYAESIPRDVPIADTDIIKKVNLTLTRDKTVSGNKAWVALPVWQSNWSSGTGDVTEIAGNFISPKYGPGYVAKIFKGDETRIPELSDLSWVFDYKAGVLMFESDPGQNGVTESTSIKIEVYQYTGRMVSESWGRPGRVTGDSYIVKENEKVVRYDSPGGTVHLIYFESSPPGAVEDLTGRVKAVVMIDGDKAKVTGINYKNVDTKTEFLGVHEEILANTDTVLDEVKARFGGVIDA